MATLTFDLDSLTLGELAAAETASGLDTSDLLGKSAHRLLLAVFVQRLRSSGSAPNWQELGNLKVRDAQSSISGSQQGSLSETSPD